MLQHGRTIADGGGGLRPADPGERRAPLPPVLLPGESAFYGRYRWCLDAFPTTADLREHLRGELSSLTTATPDWRRDELLLNVYLLACALADNVDDHLAGRRFDLSRAAAVLPGLSRLAVAVDRWGGVVQRLRAARQHRLHRWREGWRAAVDAYLRASLAEAAPQPEAVTAAASALASLLPRLGGRRLLSRRAKVPAAFRTQDLTHHDVLELAARLAETFRDRHRPVLVVGLRTAGSYLAPLVGAALAVRGHAAVETTTLRPKRGVAPWERAALTRCASRGALAVLVDEPPDTGATVARAVDTLRRAGFAEPDVVALLPIHPSRRDWRAGHDALPLCGVRVVSLDPQDWQKHRRLDPRSVEGRLAEYFTERGYASATVVDSTAAEALNRDLDRLSEQKFHTRLKRVYEVRLQAAGAPPETRLVIAKSVGWGWLSYHAFLAGVALAEFVPPLLGLRDGIVYSEWVPQPRERNLDPSPARLASYVAARTRRLALTRDPVPRLARELQKGPELLAAALAGAYGWKPTAVLRRHRIQRALTRQPCPVPTLIDGRMQAEEWLAKPSWLKADFEHHGMGKTELNVTDPAYDLADAVLGFHLSPDQERDLLCRYRELTGDQGVEERLFLQKVMAGTAALNAALTNLADPRLRHRHAEFDRRYRDAAAFLTAQAARVCGALARPAAPPVWRAPLVVMDVDGVLDKQVFGFPTTTAAGIRALRLLHAHGVPLALNTARTLAEVREYSRAYGLLGGVAEYGAVAWDAVSGRTRVLVSPATRDELARLADALRRLPGVFLNDSYEHSLRAYSYQGARAAPVPHGLVQGLASDLRLTRIAVHQTFLDTTVVAAETDKGRGLLALLEMAGVSSDVIAIGDSEPDLPMFRVAHRSFAPRHISGRTTARLLGCEIAPRSYQRGLLAAARRIVHPGGGACAKCDEARRRLPSGLWWDLLETADRHPLGLLLRALADPRSLGALRR